MPRQISNITGHTFGELTVTAHVGTRRLGNGQQYAEFAVRCPVGHTEIRTGKALKNSGSKATCKTCGRNPRERSRTSDSAGQATTLAGHT